MRSATTALAHSQLAYSDYPTVRQRLHLTGAELIDWLDGGAIGTAGYVAQLPTEETVIAFRGSEMRANDWRVNLDREPVMGLHRGFYSAIVSIRKQLMQALELCDPQQPLIVTGHSMGGALAIFAANEISVSRDVREVHTFGSPRVGDATFSGVYDTALATQTWRHVHCCDIVPRLPSRWKYGYEHVGHEVYYDCWGQQFFNPSRLFKFYDRALGRLEHLGRLPTRGIADHALSAYSRVVKNV